MSCSEKSASGESIVADIAHPGNHEKCVSHYEIRDIENGNKMNASQVLKQNERLIRVLGGNCELKYRRR